MKKVIIIFVFLNFSHVFSQEVNFPLDFTNKEVKNLKQLNLSFNNYSFDDINFNQDLKELAHFNKKRKQNKVWAYSLSGIGVFLLATGTAIDSKKDIHGFKSLMYLNSVMYLGTSIPFFIGNRKNKKKMQKKLIFIENKLQNHTLNKK